MNDYYLDYTENAHESWDSSDYIEELSYGNQKSFAKDSDYTNQEV